MPSRFDIKAHAVERYMKRYAPEVTYRQALLDVEHLVSEAAPVKGRAPDGSEVWRSPDPAVYFVVKPEAASLVVVTTLAPSMGRTYEAEVDERTYGDLSDTEREVIAAYERIRPLVEKVAKAREDGAALDDGTTKEMRVEAAAVHRIVVHAKAACDPIKNRIENLKRLRDGLRAEVESLLDIVGGAQALKKQLKKQTEHAANANREREKAWALLSLAVRAAVAHSDDPIVGVLLGRIALAEPRVLEPRFYERDVDLAKFLQPPKEE